MGAKQVYRECPACRRLMPYLIPVCDCGRRFTGSERRFQSCPNCGSVHPSGQIICECGHILLADQKRVTAEDIEAAFAVGFGVGIQDQRQRDDVKWEQFFADAKLKNTVTGEPIQSLDDFLKWKAQFAEAQKRPKAASDQPSPPRETVYLMEDEEGFLARVPESKLEAWLKEQKAPSTPLNRAERQLVDRLVQEIYGKKEEGHSP